MPGGDSSGEANGENPAPLLAMGGLGYQSLPLWGRHSVTEKREGRVGGDKGTKLGLLGQSPWEGTIQGEDVKTETTAATNPIAIVRRMSQNSRLFITEPP